MPTLLLATDAWNPQLNGVVRTLKSTIKELTKYDIQTKVIEPSQFNNYSCPLYNEIRLANPVNINQKIESIKPNYIHISTEGPIGVSVRNYCVKRKIPFTTSYHTRFPEYLNKILLIPTSCTYRFMRWFHRPSHAVLVPTNSIKSVLNSHKIKNVKIWSRGVDTTIFKPIDRTVPIKDRPVFLYVGRLSKEKNIPDFLNLPLKGTYWVVGDGPERKKLQRKYGHKAKFFGALHGVELANKYGNASVMVFPSKTDTFGLVILESMACGTPVAAYPATGPIDIFTNQDHVGYQHISLEESVKMAIKTGNRSCCVKYAQKHSWSECTKQFMSYLKEINLS